MLPPVEELQTEPDTRAPWINYSAFDAKATYELGQVSLLGDRRFLQLNGLLLDLGSCLQAHAGFIGLRRSIWDDDSIALGCTQGKYLVANYLILAHAVCGYPFTLRQRLQRWQALQLKLDSQECIMDADVARALKMQRSDLGRQPTMWDMYDRFWRPFGEQLTDMETAGMLVDRRVVSRTPCIFVHVGESRICFCPFWSSIVYQLAGALGSASAQKADVHTGSSRVQRLKIDISAIR